MVGATGGHQGKERYKCLLTIPSTDTCRPWVGRDGVGAVLSSHVWDSAWSCTQLYGAVWDQSPGFIDLHVGASQMDKQEDNLLQKSIVLVTQKL